MNNLKEIMLACLEDTEWLRHAHANRDSMVYSSDGQTHYVRFREPVDEDWSHCLMIDQESDRVDILYEGKGHPTFADARIGPTKAHYRITQSGVECIELVDEFTDLVLGENVVSYVQKQVLPAQEKKRS